MTVVAFGQANLSTIAGTLTDPDGQPVIGAMVQVVYKATGTVFKTNSNGAGSYTIARLPAGEYDLVVPIVGFTIDRFERKGIGLQPAQTTRIDARLQWSFNLGTPGDDVSGVLRNRYGAVSGPTPRTKDGKPDLSGVWNGDNDPSPEVASALAWAEKLFQERITNGDRDDPSARCLPGPYLGGPLLYKFVQTPKLLVQIFEGPPNVRQVFMDGRDHPRGFDPSWTGHSTGKWEGDTLAVDTVGFNDKSWLDLHPHTEMLHIVERYRRRDMAHLQVDVTFEDPGTFTKPWHNHSVWTLAPGEEILEYLCGENNKDVPHLSFK